MQIIIYAFGFPVVAMSEPHPCREPHPRKSRYGFGAALNEESLKNLKYCLDWLLFLNAHLGKLVPALKNAVAELDDHQRSQMGEDRQANGRIARALPASYENSRAGFAAKVESLKGDAVATMKKVVEVVSNCTGSALPENARELIKRTPLPLYHSSSLYYQLLT